MTQINATRSTLLQLHQHVPFAATATGVAWPKARASASSYSSRAITVVETKAINIMGIISSKSMAKHQAGETKLARKQKRISLAHQHL